MLSISMVGLITFFVQVSVRVRVRVRVWVRVRVGVRVGVRVSSAGSIRRTADL